MSEKIEVGVLFGGESAEHEISIRSANNVIEAMDREKYRIFLIGITRDGRWYAGKTAELILESGEVSGYTVSEDDLLGFVPGRAGSNIVYISDTKKKINPDVIFPVLHGPMGEDGTVQGLLRLSGIPFVGAGVLGSAASMDKDVMKRLFRDNGIPVGGFRVMHSYEKEGISYDEIVSELGSPLFIKPANMGSSVGVNKVGNREDFYGAVTEAFRFDNKILVEEFIEGRELECAVLGNEYPIASATGEICARDNFYSYRAKYIDENGAVLNIPAELPDETNDRIKDLALKSFRTVCCEGMARVDCFLKKDGTVIVNEINTIPGFTSISMYPMLFEVSGIPYNELIDRLICLAMERGEKEKRLETDYKN